LANFFLRQWLLPFSFILISLPSPFSVPFSILFLIISYPFPQPFISSSPPSTTFIPLISIPIFLYFPFQSSPLLSSSPLKYVSSPNLPFLALINQCIILLSHFLSAHHKHSPTFISALLSVVLSHFNMYF